MMLARSPRKELEHELASLRLAWQTDRAELERLRTRLCTCGQGGLEPGFHDTETCPAGVGWTEP